MGNEVERETEERYQHKNMEIWRKKQGDIRKREGKRYQIILLTSSASFFSNIYFHVNK